MLKVRDYLICISLILNQNKTKYSNLMPSTNNNIIFYTGPITQVQISILVEDIEKEVKSIVRDRSTEKKIINISIEMLQNLFHHAQNQLEEELAKSSIFSISMTEGNTEISTGNYISAEKVSLLKKTLVKINSLSKEALREFHKTSMQSSRSLQKSNAGLGLIVIARQAGNKLKFEFEKKSQDLFYFSLTVKIN